MMDKELLIIAEKECGLKVKQILLEGSVTKEYKLYKLDEGLRKIEDSLQDFKKEFVSKFGIQEDQVALRGLQKICLVNAKDCIMKLMCFASSGT